MAAKLPPGYALERKRVTWTRTETRGHIPRTVTSHPIQAVLTEPDGNVRYFDTSREALEWLANPDNVWPVCPAGHVGCESDWHPAG